MYTRESLNDLRQSVDLVDWISSHVQLKRAGGVYKGLCPFHQEKTPSFVVQDTHYHCFGCGAHGDALSFSMHHLKLSFKESAELLAERYSVSLEISEQRTPFRGERPQKEKSGVSKTELRHAIKMVADFYHFALFQSVEGRQALLYLKRRSLTREQATNFMLGWAPLDGTLLPAIMAKEKISPTILEHLGILTPKGRDRFCGRLIFPIHDLTGQVVGFSGRTIPPHSPSKDSTSPATSPSETSPIAKYVNSPSMPLFHKSKVLFGWNQAKNRIALSKHVTIVEGQIDVIQLQPLCNVIAPLGTAFGEHHIRILQRAKVHRATLLLDGDEAGQKASFRLGHELQKVGIEVQVVSLPEGKDPDLIIHEEGWNRLRQYIDQAAPYLTFLVSYSKRLQPNHSAHQNVLLARSLAQQVQEWEDPLLVHHGLRQLEVLLELPHISSSAWVDVSKHASAQHTSTRAIGKEVEIPKHSVESNLLQWLLHQDDPQNSGRALCLYNLSLEDMASHHEVYQTLIDPQTTVVDLHTSESEEVRQWISSLSPTPHMSHKKRWHSFFTMLSSILRNMWLKKRDSLRKKIQATTGDKKELIQQFDNLKNDPPTIQFPDHLDGLKNMFEQEILPKMNQKRKKK